MTVGSAMYQKGRYGGIGAGATICRTQLASKPDGPNKKQDNKKAAHIGELGDQDEYDPT